MGQCNLSQVMHDRGEFVNRVIDVIVGGKSPETEADRCRRHGIAHDRRQHVGWRR